MAGLLSQYPWLYAMGDRPGLLGYEARNPYPGELSYFEKNPFVAGMAAEDDRITLNPAVQDPRAREAVMLNEAVRLFMRQNNLRAPQATKEQLGLFSGTPYASDPQSLGDSIVARLLSGDPSARNATQEQQDYAKWLSSLLKPEGW